MAWKNLTRPDFLTLCSPPSHASADDCDGGDHSGGGGAGGTGGGCGTFVGCNAGVCVSWNWSGCSGAAIAVATGAGVGGTCVGGVRS